MNLEEYKSSVLEEMQLCFPHINFKILDNDMIQGIPCMSLIATPNNGDVYAAINISKEYDRLEETPYEYAIANIINCVFDADEQIHKAHNLLKEESARDELASIGEFSDVFTPIETEMPLNGLQFDDYSLEYTALEDSTIKPGNDDQRIVDEPLESELITPEPIKILAEQALDNYKAKKSSLSELPLENEYYDVNGTDDDEVDEIIPII